MKKLKFGAFAALTLVAFSFAQSKKGTITYDLKMEGNPQMEAMGSSTLTLSFDDNNKVSQMVMMGGMMQITTIENKTNNPVLLYNVMGQKYEVTGLDKEKMKAQNASSITDSANEIKYFKSETKTINGISCYKAVLVGKDSKETIVYITDKFTQPAFTMDTNAKVKLEGTPLEINLDTPNGKLTLVATNTSEVFNTDVTKIPEGYKKVTMEEFQQQMGGM